MRRIALLAALCSALLAALTPSMLFGLGTPAGTALQASCTVSYLAGADPMTASATLSAHVAQTPGVALQSGPVPSSIQPGQVLYAPLSATNTGNAPDSIALSCASAHGWGVLLIRDDDNDGVLQPTETTAISGTGALGADAGIGFFVRVTVPVTATTGDTVTITATSIDIPTTTASITLSFPAPAVPTPTPSLPGDLNLDGIVNGADAALFALEWARWHSSRLPVFNASIDAAYDIAPHTPNAWPDWAAVGDGKVNIQDATALTECFMGSRAVGAPYGSYVQTTRTMSLTLVRVSFAPYGVYQASIPVGSFNAATDGYGNLKNVLRSSGTGNILYSEYDTATGTIRITGNVSGRPPYSVASIYTGR